MSGQLTTEQALILSAAAVYRRDVPGFQTLVEALQNYANDVAFNMRAASPDQILKVQGMAVQAHKLAELFATANIKATKIEEKTRG